jgi:hypothetical protein
VRPDRERKSSGSETAFAADLTDPEGIEAGVLAMADDVWAWCEKTGGLGRTVTVKIKWADFQQSTRSRSQDYVETADQLQAAALSLIRSLFPPAKAVRLVGVTLSNFWRGAENKSGAIRRATNLPCRLRWTIARVALFRWGHRCGQGTCRWNSRSGLSDRLRARR